MALQWIVEILIICAILLAHYLYSKRRLYQLSLKLPGPFALPLLGNALSFLCDDDEIYEKAVVQVCSKYPSPMRFWLGPKLLVVFTDVSQAEKIMSSVKFATKDEIYKFIEPFDGLGLITASGPKWKRDRRLMSPLFLKKNITQYFPHILNHTKILVDLLKKKVDQPTFNINPDIHKCVADFINEIVLGVKTRAQFGEMERFVEMLTRIYTVIHARMIKVWLQVDWIFRFTHYWQEQQEGIEVCKGFMHKALKEAQDKHSYSKTNSFRPVIDQLLDINNEVPNFATEKELLDHLVTLYSASEDTITTIASFTLVLLGMYKDVEQKVMDEIQNLLGDRDIEENDLSRFEYLDKVLKDVLRLFPIGPFIVREASGDFQIDKWTIPKGCTVMVSIQNIHRDPRHWEHPNEFYPDHFMSEAVRKRHPYAFMPFSAGPRGCIGKPLAYMALKIIIVTILQNFTLESDGKLEDRPLKMDISVRFKDEFYPVRLKEKNCIINK